jgi:hypothetical protein
MICFAEAVIVVLFARQRVFMQTKVIPAVLVVCLSCCTLALSGCSGGAKGENYKVVPLKGKVTMGGAPLADADVLFLSQGSAPAGFLGSAGRTDAQGNYIAFSGSREGIPPGKYKVTVKKWVGPDGKAVVPSEGMDIEQLKASGSAQEGVPALFSDQNQTLTEVTVPETGTPPPFNIDIK